MKILLGGLILLSAGCVPPPRGDPVPPLPPEHVECNAAAVQGLVGRQESSELAAEAQRLSGARAVRVLRPGQMITIEYRADRLNIRVDTQQKVLAVTCG
ncbi:I78 family peptidase inhibitor [Allosphingosinicella sp.]|uniref:I78 family peptidase inhibitor n=1 Tax=Allosphingosinicella sp. TaxID=2823234 RepID=UPI003784E47A